MCEKSVEQRACTDWYDSSAFLFHVDCFLSWRAFSDFSLYMTTSIAFHFCITNLGVISYYCTYVAWYTPSVTNRKGKKIVVLKKSRRRFYFNFRAVNNKRKFKKNKQYYLLASIKRSVNILFNCFVDYFVEFHFKKFM